MNRPPKPSLTVRAFRSAFGWTMHVSKGRAALVGLAAFAGVAALDQLTGPTVSVTLGYLVVITLTAWTLRERAGFTAIAASLLVTNLINGFGAHPVEGTALDPAIAAWNAASRGIICVLIVMLVSTLRHLIDLERWRAGTDALTGVSNKRAFTEALGRSVESARRSGERVLLAYMDLDGFKGVNDGFGHAAGDRVLRAFAREASTRIRDTDLFARVGGDEFAVLMVLDHHVAGEAIAEVLHARLNRALAATGHKVSCSMGAVIIDKPLTRPLSAVIEAADALTYEVKRSGKNALRIAFLDETPLAAPPSNITRMRQAA